MGGSPPQFATFSSRALSPAFADLKICFADPGADAPGFMLSPASQAKTVLLCKVWGKCKSSAAAPNRSRG